MLLGIGFVNSLASLWYADERYGNTIHPVTRIMIEALQGAFTIIPLIIAIYYAGELVWRDRDRRMHEIVDADARARLGVRRAEGAVDLDGAVRDLGGQRAGRRRRAGGQGLLRLEVGKYFVWYVLPTTVSVVLFAVLAIFMQTLVSHKTFGWMLMLLFVVGQTRSIDSASSTTSTSTRAIPARRSPT